MDGQGWIWSGQSMPICVNFNCFHFPFWMRVRWTSQDLYGYDGIACRQKVSQELHVLVLLD